MTAVRIELLSPEQRSLVAGLLFQQPGTSRMVSRGELWDARDHPGFLTVGDAGPVGLLTYRIQGDECEISTLCSCVRGQADLT
jgi:hypothetical protein